MIQNLKKALIVSRYTASEIINSKILLNTLFIGIGLFVLTFVAFSFSYGDPARIAIDFGLGMLSLSSVGIAIFMGVSLLYDEIENRTIYQVISRPVKRSAFLVGKILGLGSVLVINILILSILSLILYFGVGGEYNSLILWTILFTILEAILVLVIVTFFSLLTSKVLSVILTICLYIAGHAISGVKLLTFVENRPYLEKIIDAYQFLLPGFYKLNIKDFLLYKKTLPWDYLASVTLYGCLYTLALVSLSIYIFNKKDLN
jgi:ABC-type transport system involved in multi-copper enzyme maturation permease subunit